MSLAIRVQDLWKEYALGGAREPRSTLYDALSGWLQSPLRQLQGSRFSGSRRERFWALSEVGFDVEQGQVLGVIGRNGAGKSTLLKILSRITEPTRGRVEVCGRVSSLLEVGTGFHPELTGRENIFLNGAILGMSRLEIARKFDEIVAFAEVERFLETPVKRYSSGMYVRLAFAVAAHLEPDVLVIDEVLAVGDGEFQRKCMQRMGEVGNQGRTILFVSHNLAAVERLCKETILLEGGRLKARGRSHEVVAQYTGSGVASEASWQDLEAPGGERARIRAVSVRSPGGNGGSFPSDVALTVEIDFELLVEGLESLAVVAYLHDVRGMDVLSSMNTDAASAVPVGWFGKAHAIGRYRASFEVPADSLNAMSYSVSVFLVTYDPARVEAAARQAVSFVVGDAGTMREERIDLEWHGVVRPRLAWATRRLG